MKSNSKSPHRSIMHMYTHYRNYLSILESMGRKFVVKQK